MFYEDLARGKKGETYVKKLMALRSHKVVDVSEQTTIGFDFYISDKKVELKTDYVINRTNNLFLEDSILYSRGGSRKGWFKTCKADYLFYLDEHTLTLYIYQLSDIRKYIEDYKGYIPYRSVDDGYKRVYGYCLDKDLVEHQTITANKSVLLS